MKNKLVSVILALSMAAVLSACEYDLSELENISVSINGSDSGSAEEDAENEGDDEETEKEDDEKEDDEKEDDEKDYNADIDEVIEEAGKAYDGVSEYSDEITSPWQAAVYLKNAETDDRNINEDGLSKDEKEELREYKALLEKLEGFFTREDLYEKEEGKDFIIAGSRIFKYSLSDSKEIVDTLKRLKDKEETIALKYSDEYDARGFFGQKSGILSGVMNAATGMISNAIESKTAYDAEAAAGGAYEEEGAYEDFPEEPAELSESGPDWNTEEYDSFKENRFMSAKTSPFSTFGMDVDTASYANMRRMIINGWDIPKDSIRTEEMVNYFDYDEIECEDDFGIRAELADTPWNKDTKLLRIGVQAKKADIEDIDSNIVFLIDTSGSMYDLDKLPLVQKAFLILLNNLDENDRISLVTYAGDDTVRFKSLTGEDKKRITEEILGLEAAGGTNGASGILTAYELAEKNFIKGGNNRVILATDGDLNIGITSESDLVDLISQKRDKNIFLSVLGVGEGNYKDSKMKALADNGNGNFAYIDCSKEAERVLDKEFESVLYTVAKDAKMQVEFNPDMVKGYRQIGYESRQLEAEDFADDTKDGAEIGSGQHVTVLYEIVPSDSDMDIPDVESRYSGKKADDKKTKKAEEGSEGEEAADDEAPSDDKVSSDDEALDEGDEFSDEYLVIKIRYKEPEGSKSRLIERPVTKNDYSDKMSDDMSWAAGVAQTAMVLRDSEFKGDSDLSDIFDRLKENEDVGDDEFKAQFLYLLKKLK